MTTLEKIYQDLGTLQTQIKAHDEFDAQDDMAGSVDVLRTFIEKKQAKAKPAGTEIALNVLSHLRENIRLFSKKIANTDVEKKLATDVVDELTELERILQP